MGSSEDLYEMEDIVKKKYMDIIKNMSRVELKKNSHQANIKSLFSLT